MQRSTAVTPKNIEYTSSGVRLRDPYDTETLRNDIYDKVESAFKTVFPQSYGGVTLTVDNLKWADPDIVDKKTQKEFKASNKFLSRRLRGTLTLKDDVTGEELDKETYTLMHVPVLTERGTFIHNGNEYTTATQSRLLSGNYIRKRESGEVEAQINPRQGTGSMLRLHLEPSTGIFRLDMRGSEMKLYPLLKSMGVEDSELLKRWGKDLLKINMDASDPRVVDRAYARLIKQKDASNDTTVRNKQLSDVFDKLKLHKDTVSITMPSLLSQKTASVSAPSVASGFKDYGESDADVSFGVSGLLDTTEKILRVNRNEAEPDERDNIVFKRYYTPDDLLRERILLDSGKFRLNTMRNLARTKSIKKVFKPGHFDSYFDKLLSSSLSAPSEEINPLQLLDQMTRVTGMGEGGIQTDSAITSEAQNIMPSQAGFISLYSGPESGRAGIDARLSDGVRFGDDNKLYQKFLNPRTNKYVYLSPSDLVGKNIKIAD